MNSATNGEWAMTTDWLRARTAVSPHATALVIQGESLTFQKLDHLVDRMCVHLHRAGVGLGEHVGMLMPNSLAAVCCVFAIARLGAVLVPLNTRLTSGEIGWQIERANCHRLVCVESNENTARKAIGHRLPVEIFPDHDADLTHWLTSIDQDYIGPHHEISLNAVQAIIFTSGTTGYPKGAMITFANHFWSATGSAFRLGVHTNDQWLACLPLYHVGGLAILFRSCLYGTVVELHNGFEVEPVLNSLREGNVTLVSLVPTMLARLLASGLTDKSAPGLRLILLGGASASPQLLAEAAEARLPVAVSYGLTEACSQVATLNPASARLKPGSAGSPLMFTQIKIVDENGRPSGPSIPGEIVVAGPTIMAGYYADPEATSQAMRDGWLHTGDVGLLDDEGDLWVLDRRSDLIVSGGENIYPAEVERVLLAHPAVAMACVVGLPHPEWGQQVTAMVVIKPDNYVTQADLMAFIRGQLAGYKRPKLIVQTDEMPLTGSGKIQRSEVAKRLAAQLEVA